MKRDRTGKFIHSWGLESKQAVNLSLTKTAWQNLKQEASKRGISRSELVERFARSFESGATDNYLGEGNGNINASENFQRSEERFREIIDAIPQIVWTCKPTGEAEYFNQQALHTFGINLEQLFINGWHPLVHPEDLQPTINAWMTAVTTGNDYQIEYRLKIADGSYRWYLGRAIPKRDRIGKIRRWFGTCTDIHDRKQQAQTQANQYQWLEAVMNLLPIPLLFIDPDTACFTFANQAAKEMAGGEISRDRPAGIYDTDFYCTDATGKLIPPEQLPAVRVARGEKIQGAELNWHTPNHVYPLLVHADTLPAMHDRPAIGVMVFQDIRDRKQTELQLQQNQRFIQRVADATPGILYIYDLIEQRNVYVNRQIGELLGYTATQVQAMGDRLFAQLLHPEDFARLPAHIEQMHQAQDGEIIEWEYRIQHSNGEWRWFLSRNLIFSRTENGLPQQIIGISHDITDRKQVEAALQASEAQARARAEELEAFMEVVPVAVWLSRDPQCHQVTVNPAAYELMRATPGSVATATPADGVYPFKFKTQRNGQDILPEELSLQKAGRTGQEVCEEAELVFEDGVVRHIYGKAVPIKDEQGKVRGVVGAYVDISNRKQLEAELRRQERQFKTLAENAPDIISRVDANFRHLYVSPAVEPATGMPKEAFIGKTNADLGMPEEICKFWQDNLQQVFSTGQSHTVEFSFLTPNGKRWYQSRLVPEFAADNSVESILGIARDVTDYKQVEQALRQSQERYCSLAESLPQLVCMSDADGMTNYCNQSWIDYSRLTLEKTQGNGWQQVVHPEELPIFMERWTEALKRGNSFTIELRLRRFDNVYRWHLSRTVPIKAENGSIVSWLGTATDIDDRKRSEQRERFLAQASQTFAAARLDLQTILDTITQLIGELTGDTCILSLLSEDKQWLKTVSFHHINTEVKEFLGKLLQQPRSIQEGMAGEVARTGEMIFLPEVSPEQLRNSLQREYLPYLERFGIYSLLIVPLKVQEQIIGTLGISREIPGNPYSNDRPRLLQDIADRAAMAIANARLYQQAQQARKQAEQLADRTSRLQLVTAALSESLTPTQVAEVIVEQSISVLNASAALVAIVCENRTELEIIHSVGFEPEIVNRWRRISLASSSPLPDAVRTGQPVWEESKAQRVTHYPHLEDIYASYDYVAWISLPLMVEGRAVGGITLGFKEFSSLNQDERAFMLALSQQAAGAIARAQLYEAEQRARATAEAANRTKDEFLAVLSHELRTPLNPILGWTSLLRQGNLDAKKTAAALETIERNAKLQVQLIEDLLDISRILQGKLNLNSALVDLKATINAAIETVRLAAEAKAIQIHSNFTLNVSHVLGDAGRLQQVVWNLLSNAVKFTPTGGRIEIKLETIDTEAQIQVTDTGRGINSEFLPYVFDYFRQADSSITRTFGGLGLGLAIVRHIVELHGGTVKAQSPGDQQGATFTVRLPLLLTPTSIMEEEALTQDTLTLEGIEVLVVDDEPDNLELVAFILETAGANAIVVSSAKEVLQRLNQKVPDILLADIGMPQMDGYTLLREIRALPTQQGGEIKAIALTAYAGEINRQQALQAGFQNYLSKPVDPEELVEAIAQVLQGE
ncbi:hybrid sensor histidine kinase/response regulator [Calothrix sp. NIES-2098]|uniref:hybrid sensor histidine kinase/response regulator n=1 Tax=Calothrix sp. NIES-2098 TaxID=1954171 RepID=UPI000B5F83D6|nr:multi-sensor hybrid multi-kinase [Calothrix sp. NIES-2098]